MEDIQGVIREFVTWLKAKGEVDSSVTYDEAIDEFTDWLTCRNDLTGVSVSGEDMPASGASIRTLIRSKLKVPFVTHEDVTDNKIYFFSSERAKQLWLAHRYEDNNEDYQALILYSMTKPSDYVIDISDSFITAPRYIVSGDENQEGLKMVYTWDVKLGDRSEVDNLLVTYTITCPSGKTHQLAESKNYGQRLNTTNPLNLYKYMESGVNQVDVLFAAQNTGAKKSVRLFITVMEFNLQSTFQYYNRVELADSFVVPVTLNRNVTTQSANIYVSIDGQLAAINGQSAGLPYTVNAGVTGVSESGARPLSGYRTTCSSHRNASTESPLERYCYAVSVHPEYPPRTQGRSSAHRQTTDSRSHRYIRCSRIQCPAHAIPHETHSGRVADLCKGGSSPSSAAHTPHCLHSSRAEVRRMPSAQGASSVRHLFSYISYFNKRKTARFIAERQRKERKNATG